MTTPKVNPALATPQAPLALRTLRAGSKGHARALAAQLAGKPPPAEEPDDDEEEDNAGGAVPQPGEPNTEGMASASEACKTASAACVTAQEQLDATSAELDGGTDSISTLQATEAACDEAIEELQEAKAKCAALRGAEAEEPPADPPPAAPPPGAQARILAAASPVATGEAHLQTARLADLGRFTLQQLGETDTKRARGALVAKLGAAQGAETATAAATTARVREAWSAAIRRGAYSAGQVWEQGEKDGKRAPKFTALAAKINARHPDVEELEGFLENAPALTPRDRGAPADADASGRRAADDATFAADSMLPSTAALAKKSGLDPVGLARMTDTLFAHLGA